MQSNDFEWIQRRIFVLVGIINQLSTTHINRYLAELDIPMAQFSLLSHFSHNPEQEWTVTRLAFAFEVNQPAMTKTLKRLLSKGYVSMRPDEKDKRVKHYRITESGLAKLHEGYGRLQPDIADFFASWKKDDLVHLQQLLERLKTQLDEARDP